MLNHILIENLKIARDHQVACGCKLGWYFSCGNTFLTNAENSLGFPGKVVFFIWSSYTFDFDGERVRFRDFTFEEFLARIPEVRESSRFERML
jgi:hypothetical protein